MSKKTVIFFIVKCCLITACLLINMAMHAQNLVFKHLTTNDGLSSGNIWSIIQDSKGYLWFGTEDGLNKYDAYQFTVYRHNPEDSSSISDNAIQAILEDNDGLWIGTRNGLDKFSYNTDNFKHYAHFENNFSPKSSINGIAKDKNGNIWVATNYGFHLYDRKADNFNIHLYKSNNTAPAADNNIRSIAFDSKNILWLSTENGIHLYDPKKNTFIRQSEDLMVINSSFILYTYLDKKGNAWIGTSQQGLFYYDIPIHKLYHYTHNPADLNSLCYDQVNQITEDNAGNIWISTNGGLSYIPSGTKICQNNSIFKSLKQKSIEKNGLTTNVINLTYLGKDNRLWVGGRFGDIDFLDVQNKQFSGRKFTDIDNRFTSNNMTAIVEDQNENIWFGTDGGGIYYWDRKADKYTVYNNNYLDKNSLACDKILALCIDSYNNLWIGMWKGGG